MSSFHDKMYNYEVTPPANAWEKIAAALDEPEAVSEFPSKLYNLEAAPPVSAWEKIKNSLDTEREIVVTRQRKLPLFIRYAAAAVIIGLMAFGAMKWLNSGTGKEAIKEANISSAKDTNTQSNNITSPNNNTVVSDAARDDAALEESKHTFAKLDETERNRIKNIMTSPADLIAASTPEENLNELHYSESLQPSLMHTEIKENLSDRYITLITPEGNIIRMSKKWGDLVCCVSGEEQDRNCKDQLQRWREKIACSPLAPSSGNFLDILSLVNSLKENNP